MHKTFLFVGVCAAAGFLLCCTSVVGAGASAGGDHHVSVRGDDTHDGTAARPLRTIAAAAARARPGDAITVHAGVYRERVDPPRGGTSDAERITYRAAPGEHVVIKGSEVVTGWQRVQHDTWQATVPNDLFGDFNPYPDEITGDWFTPRGRTHHTGAVYLNDHWLTEAASLEEVLRPVRQAATDPRLWFARVGGASTTIWAQFAAVDPNAERVEINVRRAVFYPAKPGIDYLTVRGFTMMHAATPWAPPTAEQVGLLGTHWSKGWIIEHNDIRYSVCTGITLGKHGDEFDNTSQNAAEGYVATIERAHQRGWSKANIGHHVVANNHISHCEQAGIVGSMGPAFCTIRDNIIHDIHVRQLFGGAEMAAIKFHGAIDTVIRGNHIYRANRGIWLDWMSQGTRVTANLVHDIGPSEDLFVEVNHGPFLIDNNIFLSPHGILVNSQGGAYVHNLIAGSVRVIHGEGRLTPWHKAHSTAVVDLHGNPSGDDRYYNNVFTAGGLAAYDAAKLPVFMGGNVFLGGARPSVHESDPLVVTAGDPGLELIERTDGLYLRFALDEAWAEDSPRRVITSAVLGRAVIPGLPYEEPGGSPYAIDTDYFGRARQAARPFPGPIEFAGGDEREWRVWPPEPW